MFQTSGKHLAPLLAPHGRAGISFVFDIGNVLLRWDPRHLYRKVFDDSATMEWFLANVCTLEWNLELDRGHPFSSGIAKLIARHPEWAAYIRAFDERWDEMVPGVIQANVTLLEGLHARGVPLYAITNFSREKFASARERYAFFSLFSGIVVSAHEGLTKPDPAIYRLFLDRYGLTAQACIFIDDSETNVEGARAVGMQAIHYKEPMDLGQNLGGVGIAGRNTLRDRTPARQDTAWRPC
jgi:HAD superfamily hydrolase (TIGR01509 family)